MAKTAREAISIPLNPLLEAVDSVAIYENLEFIAMIVDVMVVWAYFQVLMSKVLSPRYPTAAGGLAVEHDHILRKPEEAREEIISPMQNIDVCNIGPACRWGEVKSGRLEDNDFLQLELCL